MATHRIHRNCCGDDSGIKEDSKKFYDRVKVEEHDNFLSACRNYSCINNTITIIQQYGIMSMHGHRPDLFGNIRAGLPKRSAKK